MCASLGNLTHSQHMRKSYRHNTPSNDPRQKKKIGSVSIFFVSVTSLGNDTNHPSHPHLTVPTQASPIPRSRRKKESRSPTFSAENVEETVSQGERQRAKERPGIGSSTSSRCRLMCLFLTYLHSCLYTTSILFSTIN
jgi:hypothetical protein